jgi:excisionase family DNA binding protein
MKERTKEFLTVKDVAELLSFSEKKIYGLVEEKKIPFIRIDGSIRFRYEDLDKWLEEKRVAPLK